MNNEKNTTSLTIKQSKDDIQSWHIAIVQPKCERILGDILAKKEFEYFLPISRKKTTDKKGNEIIKERLLFYGKVFIKISRKERNELMIAGIARKFMKNMASNPNEFGSRPYATIPDSQMETFMAMLRQVESEVTFEEYNFKVGDKVRIKAGPLVDREGYVTSCPDGKSYLCVTLDYLGCAKMQIDSGILEIV